MNYEELIKKLMDELVGKTKNLTAKKKQMLYEIGFKEHQLYWYQIDRCYEILKDYTIGDSSYYKIPFMLAKNLITNDLEIIIIKYPAGWSTATLFNLKLTEEQQDIAQAEIIIDKLNK